MRIRKQPLPSAKKIAQRGLYEMMWGVKPRDYSKYGRGKKQDGSS